MNWDDTKGQPRESWKTRIDWEKFQGKDREEWNAVFDDLLGIAYAAVKAQVRTLLTYQEIEDIAIEAIYEMREKVQKATSVEEFAGCLVTCARRRAIDRLRARKAEGDALERVKEDSECEERDIAPVDPYMDACASETLKLIEDELRPLLPENQWTLLKEYYFDQLTQGEIAERYGWGVSSVGKRKQDALNKADAVINSNKLLRAKFAELGWKEEI